MTSRILVFTSEYNTENGQAVVTRRVVQNVLPGIGEVSSFVYAAGWSFKSIITWCIALWNLLRTVILSRANVVYVVCSRTTLGFFRDLPALAMTFFGKRVIVHCHGSDFYELLVERRISRFVRFIYKRCEIIVPCRHLTSKIENFVGRAHVCENFYAGEAAPDLGYDKNPSCLHLVWNSNIMASKGFFDVTTAVESVARSTHSISFTCFGKILSDEEMSEKDVEQKMSNYNNRKWYQYLGLIKHADAVNSVQNCDVVALPSRYRSEMQPLAIIEAMCAGKRVIVSDSASLRVTVGGYPAEFVPVDSSAALTECLTKLYREKSEDPTLFAARNIAASKLAKDRFSTVRFDETIRKILTGAFS